MNTRTIDPTTRPSKAKILQEITRLAHANNHVPLGRDVFARETGLRLSDWYPHFWLRWNDAVREAGLMPNRLRRRTDDDTLLRAYAGLIRELGHVPVDGEVRLKAGRDESFPSPSCFDRFRGKGNLIAALIQWCEGQTGYADVVAVAKTHALGTKGAPSLVAAGAPLVTGYVYLIRTGHAYKIGHTKALARRLGQIDRLNALSAQTVHTIETDDPPGVEAYWHRRFAARRFKAEWFRLSMEDVAAFKRWRVIV